MFDWDRFEAEMVAALVDEAGGKGYRLVALGDLYASKAGVISAPYLGLNVDGSDPDSPADWESYLDDWAPDDWMEALTVEACRDTVQHWDEVFARYEEMLIRVCRAAQERLGIPVYLLDGDRYEETLRRCLTPAQLDELFPELAAAQAERERLATLPRQERIAHYVSLLGRFDGPIGSEEAHEALRRMGSAAIPALLPVLSWRDMGWHAAILLAQIGVADPAVLAALEAAVTKSTPDSPAQLWPCRALARLGRLDLVLAKASALSRQALATAVAAPYTSFRDGDSHPIPLRYQPLEDFLMVYAEAAAEVAEELAPGRGYCAIAAEEVDEALRGAGSPHALVRKHAVIVLGEPDLGAETGERVLPALRAAAQSDPDSEVRRLADLSVQWWQR